jgi:hypothetical protein
MCNLWVVVVLAASTEKQGVKKGATAAAHAVAAGCFGHSGQLFGCSSFVLMLAGAA